MLRRPHVAPFLRFQNRGIELDYLEPSDRVLGFVDRMLRLTRRLEGWPMRTVRDALRRQSRRVRDSSRLSGLAKAMLDLCEFRPPVGADRAREVRRMVFAARGSMWPPLPHDSEAPYAEAARELGMSVGETEELLYADRPEARLLVRAPELTATEFVDRYNLELARAVLLDAVSMTVTAKTAWRGIFRAVKLAGLMFEVRRTGRRYHVHLTGPATQYVAHPQRYGIRMARIVPALSRGRDWRLVADVVRGGRTFRYQLDRKAPFARRAPVTPYDSGWERDFAREFKALMKSDKGGWTLSREITPVQVGDGVFLPDFTLRHEDGRDVLVEIVGFWTPEYLEAKLRKIRHAKLENLIVVVFRGLAVGESESMDVSAPVVWFRDRPRITPVLEMAEELAAKVCSNP